MYKFISYTPMSAKTLFFNTIPKINEKRYNKYFFLQNFLRYFDLIGMKIKDKNRKIT